MNGKVTAIPKAPVVKRKSLSFWNLESEFMIRLSAKLVRGGAFHAPLVDFNQ